MTRVGQEQEADRCSRRTEAHDWLWIAQEAEQKEKMSIKPKPEFEKGDSVIWTHTNDSHSENNGRYGADVLFPRGGRGDNVGIKITGRVDGGGMYDYREGSQVQVPPTELEKTS